MLKIRSFSSLYFLVAAFTGVACNAGGTGTVGMTRVTGSAGNGGAGTSGLAGTTGGTAGTAGSGSAGTPAGSGEAGATGTAGSGSGGTSSPGADGGAAGEDGTAGTAGTAGSGGAAGAGGVGVENKIVLFDGTAATFNSWASIRTGQNNPWKNNGDGTMTVITGTGDIQSKMKFQDLFVHVEYMTPVVQASDTGATGQNRGNSGIYLKGSYEMQVLDSYGQPPAIDGCGAVYSVQAPMVVACNMGGMWNTYEIEFKAQTCNAQGQKTANARIVRATLNGMLVQQDVEVPHTTTAGQPETCGPAGLLIQDHTSFKPDSYRNIWVVPR